MSMSPSKRNLALLTEDAILPLSKTHSRPACHRRRKGGDLEGIRGLPVVLTVGFRPHSSENRFILDFGPPNNYRLRIRSVRWRDQGIYLCQISVHPPAILWSRLVIDRPLVHLLESQVSLQNILVKDLSLGVMY